MEDNELESHQYPLGEEFMRATEFITESKTVEYEGLTLKISKQGHELIVNALDDWGNKVLGHVRFNIGDGKELDPQDLKVDDKYQGQGIAKVMYDYVKSLGYTIARSYDQTDAGAGFWNKHRGEDVRIWEARAGGKLNRKYDSARREVKSILNSPYINLKEWGLSMTMLPKLGINPGKGISEDTPKGIYFYPLAYVNDWVNGSEELPWGNDFPYIQVFQYDTSHRMTPDTKVDPERLKATLRQYCPEEVINQLIEEGTYNNDPYWFIYNCLIQVSKNDESTIIRWNKILRDLGFTSVYDYGKGWIAHNEPEQGIILDPRIIKQVQTFNNYTRKQGVAEGKVKLYTDPGYFGAEVDDTGFDGLPVVNIPTNQLVGFEPDSKMNQPKSRANVEKIVAGLKQGDKLPPLLVRKYKNGYQVLDGHHRFWAYKLSGTKSIPSRIVPDKDIEEISKQGVVESVNDYLWHGSRYRNEVLVPRQANDTGGKEESNKNAIYATPSAKVAIAMGLTTPGSDTGMFPNDPQMVLFKGGIRKGEMVYLHKVPKDLFIKHNSREWYSKPDVKEITPIEVVTVPVDKWLSLIRTATPKDLELQKKNMKKQGVAEGLDDNRVSFKVQKGKNKFATTLSVGGDPVGVYQYDADTGRSIAEIYPEFKGKGLGKLLVLHAIYTAANLGLDFQEDESRTSEYDNVLDSLSSNGYIVDDDGYWYVTGQGEQYLQQSLKQGVAEGDDKLKDPIANAILDFYQHAGHISKDPIDNYVGTAKELLSQVSDPTVKSKILDIFKQAKQSPYVQGGVVTTIGALLAGGVLSSAQKMGLSPAQTNLVLQAILNTVIPTVVSRINGKSWSDTVKYTLASAGIGTGIAGMMEE